MKNRTIHRWQWAYLTASGETWPLGDWEVESRRAWIAKRAAEGKPVGSLWKRRVSYGPWRSA